MVKVLKANKKQAAATKSLHISNKIDELKQIESIFPQIGMNDLVCAIKTDELYYKFGEKFIILVNILCLLFFKEIYLKNIHN